MLFDSLSIVTAAALVAQMHMQVVDCTCKTGVYRLPPHASTTASTPLVVG